MPDVKAEALFPLSREDFSKAVKVFRGILLEPISKPSVAHSSEGGCHDDSRVGGTRQQGHVENKGLKPHPEPIASDRAGFVNQINRFQGVLKWPLAS